MVEFETFVTTDRAILFWIRAVASSVEFVELEALVALEEFELAGMHPSGLAQTLSYFGAELVTFGSGL